MGSRLDRVTNWAKEAQKARYNAQELASAHKVSLRQLERHFQEVFNVTPKQWLNELRIEQAQKVIIENDYTIKEVAAVLGFKRVSHFCREFKRYTGMSTTDFIRQCPI